MTTTGEKEVRRRGMGTGEEFPPTGISRRRNCNPSLTCRTERGETEGKSQSQTIYLAKHHFKRNTKYNSRGVAELSKSETREERPLEVLIIDIDVYYTILKQIKRQKL